MKDENLINVVEFKNNKGKIVKARVACTVSFQVQTTKNLKQYDDKFFSRYQEDYSKLSDILEQNQRYKDKVAYADSWLVGVKMIVMTELENMTNIDLTDFTVNRDRVDALP